MTRASSPCSDAPARLSSENTIRPPKSLGLPEAAKGSRFVELMLPKKAVPPDPAGAGAEAQAEAAARAIIISSREVACTPISSLS